MTHSLYLAIFLSLIAGSAIFIGAVIADREHIQSDWLQREFHHSVTAFGGGALIAAVGLVLIPEGVGNLSIPTAALTFLAGGLLAMLCDRYFSKHKSSGSQLVAMLLDFVPETLVIGAIINENLKQAIFLAAIIFMQNVPESFNAYREMRESTGVTRRRLLFWFFLIALSGPLYALVGSYVLASHEYWLELLMTLCAGGILYLVFNDIAPQVKLENAHWPPMGALLGFMVGIIGFQLT